MPTSATAPMTRSASTAASCAPRSWPRAATWASRSAGGSRPRFIRFLEKKGELNRAIEFLPTDEAIAERKAKGLGLTSPERAVLLAYSKMWLNDELIASDLPEDPWVATALERYFPSLLKEKF